MARCLLLVGGLALAGVIGAMVAPLWMAWVADESGAEVIGNPANLQLTRKLADRTRPTAAESAAPRSRRRKRLELFVALKERTQRRSIAECPRPAGTNE
jgi:hypothetical protein